MDLNNKLGLFLGLAIGDALGAPLEFQKAREPENYLTKYTTGGPHNVTVGEWTDDTSMALALATSDKNYQPTVRMVLLKDYDNQGFVFYTNFNSRKGTDLKNNKKASMCFHWKSIRRQIRIIGTVEKVSDNEADKYFSSRPYKNKISAWASSQSEVLEKREDLLIKFNEFKKKYPSNDVPRPPHWSGWKLAPSEIEFWNDGEGRVHERLNYKFLSGKWFKELLNP